MGVLGGLRIKLQRPELMKEIRIYESVRERLVGCDLVTGYRIPIQFTRLAIAPMAM